MTKKVNTTMICTVKNEEEAILDWLKSLEKQTRLPDEVVIVDGGSTDRTVELIKEFMRHTKLNMRLIVAPGANIAQGRNIAIKNSAYDIIASTDAGCKLDSHWLENIVKPFEEDPTIDVVSGVYLPWCESEFEEIVSYLIFPDIEKLDPEKFLPSSRSVAFKKEAWKLVGGYPEWLYTAEDSLFDLKLRKHGMRFTLAKEAIVYWRVRKNIKGVFKQYYNYAKGDGLALLALHRYLVRYICATILIFLIIMLWHDAKFWFTITLLILVILWFKHLKKVRNPSLKRLFTALLVALTIEIGLFLGYLKGILTRFMKLKQIYVPERVAYENAIKEFVKAQDS